MHSEVLAYFKQHGVQRVVQTGEILLHQGDNPGRACYLESGLVLTYSVLPNGKQKNLGFAQGGQVLNVSSLLLGESNRFYAVAATNCSILVMPAGDFINALDNRPGAREALLQQMAQELDAMYDKLLDETLYDADVRVARFICRCFEKNLLHEQTTLPTIPFSQTVIADVVGISRSRVNKSLQLFAGNGWLTAGYGRLIVLDPVALHEYAFQD